ncbi:hypothetical protein AB4239_13705, partial [Vibrio sp. 10N.286.45.C10]
WRLEPSAVKVARWVLRETALGNKCRPPDIFELENAVCQNSDCDDFGQNLVSLNDLVASRSGMKKYLETIVYCYVRCSISAL